MLNDADLDYIQSRHRPLGFRGKQGCPACQVTWPCDAGKLLADRDALAAEVAARDDRIARLLTTLDQQDAAKIKAEDSVATLTATVERLAAALAATPPPGPA